jgi:hypothetical protein
MRDQYEVWDIVNDVFVGSYDSRSEAADAMLSDINFRKQGHKGYKIILVINEV